MAFLDKKERVLDVQLTSYGKFLLSRGKFKPEFYAFFDDDILYDSRAAGFEEDQNTIDDRITEETPILEAQYSFSGVETSIKRNNELIRAGIVDIRDSSVQPSPERNYALAAPLGNMRLDTDKAPAWSLDVLQGQISGSVEYKTGSHPNVRIPQLNIEDIEYKIFVGTDLPSTSSETENSLEVSDDFIERFPDGSFVRVYEDSLVLEIDEENTFFQKDNFDIEVYEITDEPNPGAIAETREVLVPLFFRKEKPLIVNDLLVDEQEDKVVEIDPSFVEYYMEILADREIDPELLCDLVPVERRDDLYNRTILNCNDRKTLAQRNTYKRTTTEVEECD